MGTSSLKDNILKHLTDTREAVLYKIFLDLQREYDALVWYRCPGILATYRVGPRVSRILHAYLGWLTILANSGGYY